MSAPWSWWKLLTDPEIQQIEKELNPFGLSYGPPISWPEEVLTRSLKVAYNRQESRGVTAPSPLSPLPPPPSPLPDLQKATEYLTGELNRILNERIKEVKTPQLAAWMRQGYYTYTHEEVWNPVAVVANNDCMMGKPAPELPRPPAFAPATPAPAMATTTTTTTTSSSSTTSTSMRKATAEMHMGGGSLFSRPPIRPPQRRDSYRGGSDGSTLQFPSPSSGPSTTSISTGTRPAPVSTSPTTVESESSHSPKRLWSGGGGGGGGGRGRGVTRTYRQGPEPTGSCPQKRPRAALQCPHCSKTFPFPSKLKDHMHIHAETKGYQCGVEFCTKAFKRRRELQAHRKTHGEIPHEHRAHHEHHEHHDIDDDEDEEMGDGSVSPSPGDPEPPDSRAATAARRTPSTPAAPAPRLPPPPTTTTTSTTTTSTSATTPPTPITTMTSEALRDSKKSASPPGQAAITTSTRPSVTSLDGLLRGGGSSAAPRTPPLGRTPPAQTFAYQSSDSTRKINFSSPGMRTTLLSTQTSPTLEHFVGQDDDTKSAKSDDSKRGEMTKAEEDNHMLDLAATLVTGNEE